MKQEPPASPLPGLTGDALVDWELVQRTLAGDHKAFELLVLKYRARVERLLMRILRHADAVADVSPDTFINAYRALHQFRGEARFYTWLHRIAANTAYKALAERKRDIVVNASELLPADAAEDETFSPGREPTNEDTPENLLAARQMAQALEQALQDLPDDHRRALELRELEGLSYEEIAVVMQCPVGTVRSRIFRGRAALAARLQGNDRATGAEGRAKRAQDER
ncbi:MAG: sigma-70 family RNA polymerase sigma factor [Brachymonas sp.]|nr:sigma-70 family RNA polymerase sigma factor [Brachymonas sp.]